MQDMRADVEAYALLPMQQRLRHSQELTRNINALAQITGQGREISVGKFMQSPAWRKTHETIVKALLPFPDAMVAVSSALKEIEV